MVVEGGAISSDAHSAMLVRIAWTEEKVERETGGPTQSQRTGALRPRWSALCLVADARGRGRGAPISCACFVRPG